MVSLFSTYFFRLTFFKLFFSRFGNMLVKEIIVALNGTAVALTLTWKARNKRNKQDARNPFSSKCLGLTHKNLNSQNVTKLSCKFVLNCLVAGYLWTTRLKTTCSHFDFLVISTYTIFQIWETWIYEPKTLRGKQLRHGSLIYLITCFALAIIGRSIRLIEKYY